MRRHRFGIRSDEFVHPNIGLIGEFDPPKHLRETQVGFDLARIQSDRIFQRRGRRAVLSAGRLAGAQQIQERGIVGRFFNQFIQVGLRVAKAADLHFDGGKPPAHVIAIRLSPKNLLQHEGGIAQGIPVGEQQAVFRLRIDVVWRKLQILLKAIDGHFGLLFLQRPMRFFKQKPTLPIDLHRVQSFDCRSEHKRADEQANKKAAIDDGIHLSGILQPAA